MGSVLGRAIDEETGSVLGAVLGELEELSDEQIEAVAGAVLGAARRRHRHHARGEHPHPPPAPGLDGHGMHRPSWRGRELAPGVNEPGEGVVPLPLSPVQAGGIWSVATTLGTIQYTGQLQKPFKSKRLIATTQRVGATSSAIVQGLIFVGVDLNMAQITPVDLEGLGAPTAFDTGMSLMQAPPGVVVQILASLGGIPPSGLDSIFLSMFFLGHIVH